ncbi:MAG: arginine--tRNA ligase, partial [Planctomycetota bacterium]
MHLPHLLQSRFASALKELTDRPDQYSGMIRPSGDPKFGDYQCNAAMPLAKAGGSNPRDVAAALVKALDVEAICEPPAI